MLAIDIALRPPGSRFAFDSVAVANSIDPVAASAMWQSLGLADPRNSGVTITAWEAEVLTAAVSFVEVLGDEGAAKIARVLGAAAARVGEAVVEALRVGVQLPQLEQGRAYADVIQHFAMLAELTYPTLVQTFDLAVRRHITAFARGEWLASDDHRAMNLDRLIGFVDIVGYTRLSSTLTAGDLAELLSAFHATVGRLVATAGGRTVKTIGDEVMFVAADAAAGCAAAVAMVAELNRVRLRDVRVGLALGPVVSYEGDYYGDVVNTAARLVGIADPMTVIAPASAGPIAESAGLNTDAVGSVNLKGFPHPVEMIKISRR